MRDGEICSKIEPVATWVRCMANHFCVFACGGVITCEPCQMECPYGDSVRCTIDIVMFGELALCIVTHV